MNQAMCNLYFAMNYNPELQRRLGKLMVLIGVLMLAVLVPSLVHAATTGAQFQTMYTELFGWAQGYLGKTIAIAAFLIGAGIGAARSNPIPAIGGLVFALFMAFGPTVIDGIATATA